MDRETRLQLAERWAAQADALKAQRHALPNWEEAANGVAPDGWPTLPVYVAQLQAQEAQLEKCIADLMAQ
jgi:hypothetical protein